MAEKCPRAWYSTNWNVFFANFSACCCCCCCCFLFLFFFRFVFVFGFFFIYTCTCTYMIPCLENKLHETVQCIYLYLRKRRIRLKLDVIIPAWFVISLLLQITLQPPSSGTQESRNFAWDYLDRVYQSVHPTPPIPWYIYIYIYIFLNEYLNGT